MTPADARCDRRRDRSVALRKGLASTTVRDVAAEMGTSSGLIHHYFESMDDVLAAAFERVARAGPWTLGRAHGRRGVAGRGASVFFRTYTPADKDWAFQLWLDAWAEAARRPAVQATSRRLNLEWQGLAGADDPRGRGRRVVPVCRPRRRRVADPVAARRAGPPGRGPRDDDHARPTSSTWATAAAGTRARAWPGACWPGTAWTLGAHLLAHEQHVGQREAGDRHRHECHHLRPDQDEALVERQQRRDPLLRLLVARRSSLASTPS